MSRDLDLSTNPGAGDDTLNHLDEGDGRAVTLEWVNELTEGGDWMSNYLETQFWKSCRAGFATITRDASAKRADLEWELVIVTDTSWRTEGLVSKSVTNRGTMVRLLRAGGFIRGGSTRPLKGE